MAEREVGATTAAAVLWPPPPGVVAFGGGTEGAGMLSDERQPVSRSCVIKRRVRHATLGWRQQQPSGAQCPALDREAAPSKWASNCRHPERWTPHGRLRARALWPCYSTLPAIASFTSKSTSASAYAVLKACESGSPRSASSIAMCSAALSRAFCRTKSHGSSPGKSCNRTPA
mgnify:CR=1 FL=1